MNGLEKRRRELLENTRALYRDRQTPPAIHPRYGNLYADLYGEDEPAGNLSLRIVLCCILFAAFVWMDHQDVQLAGVNSQMVTQAIEADLEPAQVWKNL